ncbi:hypothetical protein HN587_03390 [Candidatus Woesearchaeota archaeon]|jgi:hypothetical protein|nr:hypothetical protein [Candidatus Woesearchaeota archaeon]
MVNKHVVTAGKVVVVGAGIVTVAAFWSTSGKNIFNQLIGEYFGNNPDVISDQSADLEKEVLEKELPPPELFWAQHSVDLTNLLTHGECDSKVSIKDSAIKKVAKQYAKLETKYAELERKLKSAKKPNCKLRAIPELWESYGVCVSDCGKKNESHYRCRGEANEVYASLRLHGDTTRQAKIVSDDVKRKCIKNWTGKKGDCKKKCMYNPPHAKKPYRHGLGFRGT